LAIIKYLDDHIDPSKVYEAFMNVTSSFAAHGVAELTESFERFLKELAAACVDFLAPFTTDDRFDEFLPRRGTRLPHS